MIESTIKVLLSFSGWGLFGIVAIKEHKEIIFIIYEPYFNASV
jgi:hypothetical protein